MFVALGGRVVVITGASRGIRRACALELARAGARLALCGRDQGALTDTARQARALGADVEDYCFDVRDHGAAYAVAAAVQKRFGAVDALVNNAAIGNYGSFLDLSLADWEAMTAVNIVGVAAVTRAFLPSLLERPDRHVVNIASIQGLQATATSSAYSATKFALLGLTQSLQLEFRKQGLRVSALCPGSVDTNFDGFPGTLKESPLTPDDVALAIRDVLETGGRAYVMQSVLMPLYGP